MSDSTAKTLRRVTLLLRRLLSAPLDEENLNGLSLAKTLLADIPIESLALIDTRSDPAEDDESYLQRRCVLLTKFILKECQWTDDGPMTADELEYHGRTKFGPDWAVAHKGLAKFMAIRDVHHCWPARESYPVPPYFKILRKIEVEDLAYFKRRLRSR